MFWTIRITALTLLAAVLIEPLCAEPTPGPPSRQDGASVYLGMSQRETRTDNATSPQGPAGEALLETATAPVEPPPIVDPEVAPAAHQAFAAPNNDNRHLAPPTGKRSLSSGGGESVEKKGLAGASRRIANFGVPVESIYTVLSALALVIGAFLVFAWLLRRVRSKASRREGLPADVVSVLGRVPLAARQFAELLRVGNKLVLVSLTPNGAETLTEVTDPVEVDRLVGLCQQGNPHSTTKAFEQVFRQLSGEAAPHGFLGKESVPSSVSSPAGAYRAHRGDARG